MVKREVISRLIIIFNISIYAFLTYKDKITQKDFIVLVPNRCQGIKNCGHIIFMVNNGNHFTYLKTNIQGYDKNILDCLDVESVESSSDSKSESSDKNSDIQKLLDMGFNKEDIDKALKSNDLQGAIEKLTKKSDKDSDPKDDKDPGDGELSDFDLEGMTSDSTESKNPINQ